MTCLQCGSDNTSGPLGHRSGCPNAGPVEVNSMKPWPEHASIKLSPTAFGGRFLAVKENELCELVAVRLIKVDHRVYEVNKHNEPVNWQVTAGIAFRNDVDHAWLASHLRQQGWTLYKCEPIGVIDNPDLSHMNVTQTAPKPVAKRCDSFFGELRCCRIAGHQNLNPQNDEAPTGTPQTWTHEAYGVRWEDDSPGARRVEEVK